MRDTRAIFTVILCCEKLTTAVKTQKYKKYLCIYDALALYLWYHSISWCQDDGYENGMLYRKWLHFTLHLNIFKMTFTNTQVPLALMYICYRAANWPEWLLLWPTPSFQFGFQTDHLDNSQALQQHRTNTVLQNKLNVSVVQWCKPPNKV